MGRKLLCALLCVIFVLCTFASEVFAVKLNSEGVDWGISMSAEQVTPIGAVIVVTQSCGNHTDSLAYGAGYHLEVWKENDWKQVPYISEDVGWWTTEARGLPEEREIQWGVDWSNIYGALPNGHYRFVKDFIYCRENGNDIAAFYAEFVIKNSHTCQSEDQDQLCDICLSSMSHDDLNQNLETVIAPDGEEALSIYRVVGNTDWLGNWDPASNLGVMTEVQEGVYQKTYQDVPPGAYSLKITKNGTWEESWGDNGNDFTFEISEECDVTVDFIIKDGIGIIDVYGPVIAWVDEDERTPDTIDLAARIPAALLLVSVASVSVLLRKKNEMI